jgi:two-component system nitrogen regulation response regulator GlnG
MEKKILIVDDDHSLKIVMVKALSSSKVQIKTASTISEGWLFLEKEDFDLIICDVVLPDGDGLELVKKLKNKFKHLEFIIISAKNNILTAIKADQLDVFEYLPKPLDLNDLVISVNRSLKKRNEINKSPFKIDENLPMIGTSGPMQVVYKNIAKITKTNFSVLIMGESGTGKELVARTIHNFSDRAESSFVVINMASLPKDLIESELFGYEKGAFTGAENKTIGFFEKASGGTLFLDEIGDMPFDIQSRLLRVLQFGEFSRVGGRELIKTDVRIISATNKNLHNSIEQGLFREDLFYRLNVINITLPALRDRDDDIISLSRHYMTLFSNGKKQFDSSALNFLRNYHWPGNIRELENLFKRVSVLTGENIINSLILEDLIDYEKIENDKDIPLNNKNEKDNLRTYLNNFLGNFFKTLDSDDIGINLYEKFLDEFERPLISKTLEFCNGNQIKTSKILGINRNTLRSKIKKLNIPSKLGKK